MAPRLTPNVQFAAAALAAVIASLIIVGTAAATERAPAADGAAAAVTAQGPLGDGLHPQTLKLRYLRCERAFSHGTLDRIDVIACSIVYEELKQRVFGGSFEALHAWWRETRDGAPR